MNAVEVDNKDEPEQQGKPTSSGTVSRVRAAGASTISTVMIGNLGPCQSLITHAVKLNGYEFQALIDTGAYVSVVNHQIVVEHGWLVKKSKMQLIHAAGDQLDCLGEAELEIEIGIGAKSMTTSYKFLVVKNLCTPVLMGLELMRNLKLSIDLQRKVPLAFQKGVFKKGLRLVETIEVPARHAMLVKVEVNTSANIVATLPFHFDNSIMVANSVDKVKNAQVTALLINMDTWAVRIKKGQIIASFQALNEKGQQLDVWGINNVLPLGDGSNYVKVGDSLNTTELEQLQTVMLENMEAFATDGRIGFTDLIEHKIILEKDAKPFREKARRHPQAHLKEATRQVKEMLQQGIIEKSESPWCSEYVMVKKKTNDWRLCVDFRKLNSLTKKDSYPLPNIEECLEQLSSNMYFSQMDFASGYWQLPMAEESKELTAFRAAGEVYQFKRLPFGLTNAPATFQRLINALFAGMKGMSPQVFLDDICLATKTWPEHLTLLDRVFKVIIKAGLKLKGSKCLFGSERITFLGHEISKEGLKPDGNKVKAIKELPSPIDVSGVRRVVGAFGYYRKFIPKFAEWTEPLVALTRKNRRFDWAKEQQDAFDKLKEELANCVTLTHLNDKDPVILKTDASLIGVAGILIQQQTDGLRIVACVSRHLTPAEKNYSPMELEALAVIYSLKKFRHFLLGRHVKIITDHVALKVLNSRTTRNARVERWALALSEYDYEILYQRGKLHEDVDCLSRSPVSEERIANTMVTVVPLDVDGWLNAYDDEESQNFYELAEKEVNEFQIKGHLIYNQQRFYVPGSKRQELIKESHSSNLAAHDGLEGTKFRMRNFWWPDMDRMIEEYVRSCDECQRRKVQRRRPAGLMQPHESFQPMEVVAFDYLGPLPETLNKKKFVILAIDHFSRFVDAKAVKDQVAERFVRYFAEYCGRFGVPKIMVSDNARQFDNKCLDAIREQFGTTHQISPAGHSQGNAICERAIQSLSDKLATIVNNSNSRLDWDLALPMVMFSMNSKIHSATGYAPFELIYGRPAPMVQTNMRQQVTQYDLHAQVIRDAINKMRANAIASSSDAHSRSKVRYDNGRRDEKFSLNELVLIPVKSRSRKLGPKFEGPFKVIDIDKDIYLLENMSNPKDKRRRHSSRLKRYALAIATILLSTPVLSLPLQETLPIFWQEDSEHFVSKGEETLRYVVHYVSPCVQILEYAKILMGSQSSNINQPMQQHQLQQTPLQMQQQPVLQQQMQQPQISQSQAPQQQMQPPQVYGQQYIIYNQNHKPDAISDPLEEENQVPVQKPKGRWVSKEEAERMGIAKRAINPIEQQASILHAECENVFSKTILLTLKKFNVEPQKEKRQAAFIAGFIVSNIVQEITKAWKGQPPSPEFERQIQFTLNKMNTRTNLIATAIKAINRNLSKVQHDILELKYEAERLPSLESFQSHLISEISSKNLVLEELAIGLQQRRTNTVHLAQIFQTQKFEELEARDITIIESKTFNTNTIQLTLAGHVRSQDAKVYRVKHLDFYSN